MSRKNADCGHLSDRQLRELLGPSLLDKVVEHRRSTNHEGITRHAFVAYIAAQNDGDEQSLTSNLWEAVSGCTKQYGGAKLTGGFILVRNKNKRKGDNRACPTAIFGFLEDSPEMIYKISRRLVKTAMFEQLRILLSSDDCPHRKFADFDIYIAEKASDEEFDVSTKLGVLDAVRHMLTELYTEAKNFPSSHHIPTRIDIRNATSEKAGQRRLPVTLEGKFGRSIPSSKLIGDCAKCEHLITVDDFLKLFDAPVCIDIPSHSKPPVKFEKIYRMMKEMVQHERNSKAT